MSYGEPIVGILEKLDSIKMEGHCILWQGVHQSLKGL